MTSRRQFIQIVPAAGITLLAGEAVAATEMVSEKDAQAIALGYVTDATHANKAKYKNYKAGDDCANCALYQGKPGEASGPCPLFPGKHVAAKGWCSAHAKKS